MPCRVAHEAVCVKSSVETCLLRVVWQSTGAASIPDALASAGLGDDARDAFGFRVRPLGR